MQESSKQMNNATINGFPGHPDFSTIKVDDLDDETKKIMGEVAESEDFQEFKKNRNKAGR